MLLIIHNLPSSTRYSDVKALIKEKCGLTEMIVDNLVVEGKNKKVTVGLADEGDAALLVRKINGLYVCNQQLYVEDVRQKKPADQPYRPGSMLKYERDQYNLCSQPQFENQFYGQQDAVQFQPQPLMAMDCQIPCPTAPNFGIPFYMTAQNQNVGNNLQFMVQYPKVQGNEPYEGQDIGFAQQYGGRKGDQSMSSKRDSHGERSPRHLSGWNESDRSESGRGRDRLARQDVEHSYKDKSKRDSFQGRSNQDFGSNKRNNNRFEKSSNRSEPNWESANRSTFGDQNKPYSFNDNRDVDIQDRRYEREPQRFRENNYSQSRGSDSISRPGEFSKKRPYESSVGNKFGPPNKKFGGNDQFNSRNQPSTSGNQFSNNYQNKKIPYLSKSPVHAAMQQNMPHVQPKGLQNNKPQWQSNNQPMKHVKKQANFSKDRLVSPTLRKLSEDMKARHEAWRVQTAAVIATEILSNVGQPCQKRDPLLLKLKACVRARIDVILGDDMSVNLKDMLSKYREKFQDDEAFYNVVLKKVDSGEQDAIKSSMKGNEIEKKVEIKPNPQSTGNTPPTAPNPGNPQRLPKYPDGSKKVLSQMKQVQKEEMVNDSLYNLDAEHEKALNEEMDNFNELAKQVLESVKVEKEKSISIFMNDVFIPDLRKILTLHVKKRILNVRTNLSVRVICQYKAPKRDLLDAFLKDYGVISLKACDKKRTVMIAVCDSYESYDALCIREHAVIDNLKISFKPLNITGPPVKGNLKKQATATSKNNGHDDSATTIVNKSGNDDNERQTDESFNFQETQANEDSECEFIESNKCEDVLLIDENVNKSKDVIVIDDIHDKVPTDDKAVIDVNEALTGDTDSAAAAGDNKGSNVNKQSGPVGDERVTVNDDLSSVINDNEKMGNVEPDIDNDNIADDDLEDF